MREERCQKTVLEAILEFNFGLKSEKVKSGRRYNKNLLNSEEGEEIQHHFAYSVL